MKKENIPIWSCVKILPYGEILDARFEGMAKGNSLEEAIEYLNTNSFMSWARRGYDGNWLLGDRILYRGMSKTDPRNYWLLSPDPLRSLQFNSLSEAFAPIIAPELIPKHWMHK